MIYIYIRINVILEGNLKNKVFKNPICIPIYIGPGFTSTMAVNKKQKKQFNTFYVRLQYVASFSASKNIKTITIT